MMAVDLILVTSKAGAAIFANILVSVTDFWLVWHWDQVKASREALQKVQVIDRW